MKQASGTHSVLLACGLLAIAGCGGDPADSGGGDSGADGGTDGGTDGAGTPPPAPVLSFTPVAVKTFRFAWADVSGETEYRLFENPGGDSGPRQVAVIAADSTGYDHTVFLPGSLNASYFLQACNDAGCTDSNSVTVSGTLVPAIGYFKASNTGAGDNFGYALALSADGHTLAVGAYGEDSNSTGVGGNQDDNSAGDSGAVYVFTRTGGTWSQQAYLKASNTEAGDNFGSALALSADGNTLAVGAYGEDSNATGVGGNQDDNSAPGSGAVYVFTRSGSIWSQQAYVKASNTEGDDRFGYALALSANGDTLAVGAYREDSNATGVGGDEGNNAAVYSGAVYVFTRSADTWSQQAYVKASNTGVGDSFGYALALSADGNTLAVGAYGEGSNATGVGGNQNNDLAPGSGAVYVFTRMDGSWSQQAYVKASNTDAGDGFGYALALSADSNTLAVGAFRESSAATGVDGNQLDNSATRSGAVYLFTRTGSTWSQQAYVKASNTDALDNFGYAVALSGDGNILAVGTPYEDSPAIGIQGDQLDNGAAESGAIYLFTRSGSTWSQKAYVKASNTELDDSLGSAFALSADGNTLAVGAWGEDSNATGVGGDQNDNSAEESGAVYLY